MSYNQPGLADVHVDRPLTNILVAFLQEQDGFVASRAFPRVPVQKMSDKYFTLPRGHFFRDQMEKRAPATRAPALNYTVSTDSYNADVWHLAHDIADEIRANADAPLDLDRQAAEILGLQALIRKERLWQTEFFTTSVWTTDQTGVAAAPGSNQFLQWNDAASNPVEDIRRGKRRVHLRTGYKPNKLVLGPEVYDVLLDHPDIVGRLDRGQTTGTAMVLRQNLAELFEVDEILVMEGVYNSAMEGATDVFASIGGKAALLLYTAPNPGLMVPSAGYEFAWTGLLAGDMQMRRFRMEPEHADRAEIQMAFDHKKVSADLGQFFATAIA